MVRSNLKGATVNLLHPFLRVTDMHPFGSRGTGSVHIESRKLPIFDHEQDVRVPFGFDVETSLVAFVFGILNFSWRTVFSFAKLIPILTGPAPS